MSKDKRSKKATTPPARKGPKLSGKQQEHIHATLSERAKKAMAGLQAFQDWQDDHRRGLDRVAETIAGIEPAPRRDAEILEELRKVNAGWQGQLTASKRMLAAPNIVDAEAVAAPGVALGEDKPALDYNVTLLAFIQNFCEPLRLDLQRQYAKQLKTAHYNEKAKLPKHVGNPKRGQHHVYRAAALVKAWPPLRDYMPELPPLKHSKVVP